MNEWRHRIVGGETERDDGRLSVTLWTESVEAIVQDILHIYIDLDVIGQPIIQYH